MKSRQSVQRPQSSTHHEMSADVSKNDLKPAQANPTSSVPLQSEPAGGSVISGLAVGQSASAKLTRNEKSSSIIGPVTDIAASNQRTASALSQASSIVSG